MQNIKHLPHLTATAVKYLLRLTRLVVIAFLFYIAYKLLLKEILDGSQQIIPLFAFWLLSSYIVIPRIHRILTKYYLPNYFVGRIRSSDGLLSDPVNIAMFGNAEDIHSAMTAAGLVKADKLTPKSLIHATYCAAVRRSYASAPVGSFYLFNRKQDFAYQQEVGGSPNKRHHVRFWKTPKNWRLPGGHKADWLAAGTYDSKLGIKLSTGKIDHKIDERIDEERDYIISTLQDAKKVKKLENIKHFSDAYHDRNNGGDRIQTDGSLPFISLK